MSESGPQTRGLDRRRLLLFAAGLAVALIALYVLLPAVAGLDDTWRRLSRGDAWWLAVAAALECLSFLSYTWLFRTIFGARFAAVDWRSAYRITMAGVVATRLLAVAGAGGIALTAWALDRLAPSRRAVAASMAAFYVLLYGVFMATLLVVGSLLASGVLEEPSPPGLTTLPAALGGFVIALALLSAVVFDDLESRDRSRESRVRRWAGAAVSTLSSGVRGAVALVRERHPGLLGAPGWWAFDIAVLWSCLQAFGEPPGIAVVVMAYFVGMVANTLPIPGGIGAVEGGMIGALIGFGVAGGLAVVAVLSYRAFAFWLPILPGAVAYVQLIRELPPRTPSEPAQSSVEAANGDRTA